MNDLTQTNMLNPPQTNMDVPPPPPPDHVLHPLLNNTAPIVAFGQNGGTVVPVEAAYANRPNGGHNGEQVIPEYNAADNDVTVVQPGGAVTNGHTNVDNHVPSGPVFVDHPAPATTNEFAHGYVDRATATIEGMQVGGGGTGMRLGLDQGHVGGQAVVEGYNQEQGCGGDVNMQVDVANADVQVGGGGSPFNLITDPYSGQSFSIFSSGGKSLLKAYVKAFQHVQSGGQAPLEGIDQNAGGALYDGLPASAENLPGACGVTYDAQQPDWTATQMGGEHEYGDGDGDGDGGDGGDDDEDGGDDDEE